MKEAACLLASYGRGISCCSAFCDALGHADQVTRQSASGHFDVSEPVSSGHSLSLSRTRMGWDVVVVVVVVEQHLVKREGQRKERLWRGPGADDQ